MDIELIRYILQWCEDAQSEDMIQGRHYTYDYFADYDPISSHELVNIVIHVNPILKLCGCTIRITWSMGEIIPVRDAKTIQLIDKEIDNATIS